jgi:xylulokinase
MDTRPARLAADDPEGVAGFTLRPAIRWLATADPGAANGAAWFLNSWDWLALRLSGVAAASLAPGETPLAVSGVEDRLGRQRAVGAPLGAVTAQVAAELGIAEATLVVAGTNDGAATIVGAGLLAEGDAVDVGGASGGLAILANSPVDLPGIYSAPALLADRWVVGGAMMAIGSSFDWLREAVLGGRWSADELFAEAASTPPGADGLVFLPYLAGERSPIWDDDARGVFVGLSARHSRGHLVRAVLEGGAYALRHVASLVAAAGPSIRELSLAGRPATSHVWSQIKADVLGVPTVTSVVPDASVLGAATLGAVGAGMFPDLAAAVRAMKRAGDRYDPNPAVRVRYDALFDVYRGLYPVLRPSFEALAAARA